MCKSRLKNITKSYVWNYPKYNKYWFEREIYVNKCKWEENED